MIVLFILALFIIVSTLLSPSTSSSVSSLFLSSLSSLLHSLARCDVAELTAGAS